MFGYRIPRIESRMDKISRICSVFKPKQRSSYMEVLLPHAPSP